MTRVLITGGTGVLGRQLVAPLLEAGHVVRISSRGPRRSGFPDEVEWSQTSLSSGVGLAEAVLGVDTIVHAASTPIAAQKVDVEGTGALLHHAKAAGVSHVLYISIVGIDGFPFSYYRAKRTTEQLIEAGPVPFTILRATQFHDLLDERFLPPLFKLPLVAFVPTDLKFQVIDSGEVATRMIELVSAGPSGRVPDVGGPEVLTMGQLAAAWMPARGIRRKVVHLPLPGRAAAAFRRGQNTCPDHRYGRITWSEYLSRPGRS
ncbi:MAG TPA: SDR family oxidoreductase [Vicinamibacteria bacterium]|nr:SDR family oxidoreductase [Vicinamibacteria bacterium]